jgi:DNA-binding NarL/FixJ family response regulator
MKHQPAHDTSQRLAVVIADDHPLFRKGLRQSIEEDGSFVVVGESGDGDRALQLIEEKKPDLAVLDIDMPKKKGLEIARIIQERRLFVAVLILTVYKEEDIFDAAMDAGVRGYVLKETAAVDIIEAMKVVAQGRYYVSPTLSTYLATRSNRAKELLQKRPSLADLTTTEKRILRLVALSKTSKEIADELGISYRTVETHRTNIATKLNIHGTHSLLKFALENKQAL